MAFSETSSRGALMAEFGQFDLRRRLPAGIPIWLAEVVVAVLVTAVFTGVRLAIDVFFKDVVAYPLVFPALVVATLLAGSRAGFLVILGGQMLAWYFLAPVRNSFIFARPSDTVSLILTTVAELLLLWALILHRQAGQQAASIQSERNAELQRTVQLLGENKIATERLLAQEVDLAATRQNLEAIYQASGDGLALCRATLDADGHVTEYQVLEVNRAHEELTGATRAQMLTQKISTIYPPIDPRWFETAERVLTTGVMHDFDIHSRATGRWLNIRVSRVSEDLFQQTFVDVSDRHRLEEQRRSLMKEMSHRVMNNFQMVAGFLHLQAAGADPVAKTQLAAAERRVNVLAKLHALLAYSESEGDIDAAEYVKDICGYLGASLDRDAITLICETEAMRLPIEMAVPIGFIISELVVNSAKHAYPPPSEGQIHVSLARQAAELLLVVEDHGVGFTTESRPKAGGLGTRLLPGFVRQIGGYLTTTSERGVRHEIVFRPPGHDVDRL